LKEKLVEIRGKTEERAREVETLQKEIGVLRDQLAERYSAGTGYGSGTTGRQRRKSRIITRIKKIDEWRLWRL